MKIMSITNVQTEHGENLVVVWIKDKKQAITKNGLSYKIFDNKKDVLNWFEFQNFYNKKQAELMLTGIN